MPNSPLSKLQKLYQNQYVSYTDLTDIVTKYNLTCPSRHEIIKRQLKNLAILHLTDFFNYHQNTTKLYQYLNHRTKFNHVFIKREQKKSYQIEGNSLDRQQIAAVVACEDAELILAPAGSGKTASLLAKLDYLTNTLGIPSVDILVIAFTNKVVTELKNRIKQTDIEIRTFHSLGNKIIKHQAGSRCLKSHLITETQTREIIHSITVQLCESDPNYARRFDEYLGGCDTDDKAAAFLNLITKPRGQDPAPRLEELFISILGLQKSEQITVKELEHRLGSVTDQSIRQESLNFYHLYAPVATKYTRYLTARHLYDFADMLNFATDSIRQMPPNSFNYQYILVDEAQDLSTAKLQLLKAILKKCHRAKLFAVGDDWQSIYRFAGSNLKVLDNFEQIFERTTYRGLIETTYRFGQPTAKISNKFIQKNPHQSRKKVKPRIKRKTPIKIKLNSPNQSYQSPQDYETVDQILQELFIKYGQSLFRKSIQIISRYNHDIYRLVNEKTGKHKNAKLINVSEATMEIMWQIPDSSRRLFVSFCSMHKAKGITRDIVIIINANSGGHGIPATRSSHVVAEVLLTPLDDYPYAEERRLWYVATTRAKEMTFIVSDLSHVSPFVFEINPKLRTIIRDIKKAQMGLGTPDRNRTDIIGSGNQRSIR